MPIPAPAQRRSPVFYLVGFALLAVLASVTLLLGACSSGSPTTDGQNDTSNSNVTAPQTPEGEDLVIQVADMSETARFYPLSIDGTALEVLALKASDGSIRTAFNTCQVCYDSGQGYYVQEGSNLVCQNCGNRFSADQVEIEKGGCNPYPISDDYKKATEESITIPFEFLQEATVLFQNWKVDA